MLNWNLARLEQHLVGVTHSMTKIYEIRLWWTWWFFTLIIQIIFTGRLTRMRNLSPVATSFYSVIYLFILLYTWNFGVVLNAEKSLSSLMIKTIQGQSFSYFFFPFTVTILCPIMLQSHGLFQWYSYCTFHTFWVFFRFGGLIMSTVL